MLAAACVMSAIAAAAQDAAENLVGNPSFEMGREVPEGWEAFAPAGSSLKADPQVARSGQASAMIEISADGAAEYPAFKYMRRDVRVGEEYVARVWARTEGMTDIGGYIVLEFYQGDRRLSFAQGDLTGPGDHDWVELAVRAMVPEGTDAMKLALVAHGQGKVWFDDVTLTRSARAPEPFAGNSVAMRVRHDRVVCEDFLGFGAQGDYLLTRAINTQRGVDEQDREFVRRRVAAMRPHIIRTFFDYQWWEPEEGRQTPDSEAMRDYLGWVRFLRSIGTSVLLTPWGDRFAYSPWMEPGQGRLPAPGKRDAMVRSLVDVVEYLRRNQGLDNVKYLCLMNEPDNDPTRPVPADEYVRLNRLLDRRLRDRGLRDEVLLLTADDSWGPPSEASDWFGEIVSQGLDYCDGLSTHTYRHEYVPGLVPWIGARLGVLREAMPADPPPLLITEFGYGGETFKNYENHKYEYGLFLADFAITALREGASAALMWCLMDTYYTDELCQEYGLWRYRTAGWEPRPGFYSWSLVTRTTRPGSRVFQVEISPQAHDVRAIALESPEGELTVLMVNRYQRSIEAELRLDVGQATTMRRYEYTRERVPTVDREMIRPSAEVEARPTALLEATLPAESFVVLTAVR